MKAKKKDVVWYACYGSNIDETRFLKYLLGGKLPTIGKETKTYDPCPTDKSKPAKSTPYFFNQKLIFGLESQYTWAGHGVGFISNRKDKRVKTYGRVYLISRDQFNYLFTKENGQKTLIDINYERLSKEKKLDFGSGFYNRILLLKKDLKGYPVYSFTNKVNPAFNAPCKEYIEYIAKGIIDTHKTNSKSLFEYFGKLRTGFTKKELKEIIENLYKKK